MASPKTAAAIRPVLSVGRYEIYDRIASGGMAAVHVGMLMVGQASGLARPVAIKRLHPHLAEDPEFVAMFLDEAKLAARLSHPNIVPTLDVITQGREVFLVMEYVAGESLATVLRILNERKQLPPVEIIAAVVADALQGLGAAHRATNELGRPLGIVHRDISPQNVMVGADGYSRVLDFGIAKAADRAQFTREGQIRGKIAYLAPEQLRGTPASPRTDLFSMGVVLWESLTARRLFHATTDAKLVSRVLECRVPRPSEFNPRVTPALEAVLGRALSRNPEARFQSADEMFSALEHAARPTLRRDVGAWLQGLSGESLDRRALQIQAFERAFAERRAGRAPPDPREAPHAVPASPPQRPQVAPARPSPSSGTVPTMLSPAPPSPGPPSPGPGAQPPISPVSYVANKPPPASPPLRALPDLPPLPGHGPSRQPEQAGREPASPPRVPAAPEARMSPTSLLVSEGRALVMPPRGAPEPKVSPTSFLVSEGRAVVLPPWTSAHAQAQAHPQAPAPMPAHAPMPAQASMPVRTPVPAQRQMHTQVLMPMQASTPPHAPPQAAGAGMPPWQPAPHAAGPAAPGTLKLLPSRRYGGLILIAGIVLGGLIARAFLLLRDATSPNDAPGVVEPSSAPSSPVLSPNDLPLADPSSTGRNGAPSPPGRPRGSRD